MNRQLSVAALRVLHAVADGTHYGFDIVDVTGLPGGTVYPALSRLQRDGLLSSSWEAVTIARSEGRPPRRYYSVTEEGLTSLNDALRTLHALRPIKTVRLSPAQSRS